MALSAEQLTLRRTGIGGSEIAAVANMDMPVGEDISPYSKPIDVYLDKLGLRVVELNHHMLRGTHLERGIINWACEQHGWSYEDPGTLRHSLHPLVLATPDGIVTDADGVRRVVEVKCPSRHTAHHWGTPGTDEIPKYYIPQVMFEMAVTGLQEAYVIAFIDGNIQLYVVAFHQALFDRLAYVAHKFWHTHVLPQIPPEEDGSDSYTEYQDTLYPRSSGEMVEDDSDEVVSLVRKFDAAKSALKKADCHVQIYRQKLQAIIGDNQGLKGQWGSIYWRNIKDGSKVDWKAMAKEAGLDKDLAALAKHTRTVYGYRKFSPFIKPGAK